MRKREKTRRATRVAAGLFLSVLLLAPWARAWAWGGLIGVAELQTWPQATAAIFTAAPPHACAQGNPTYEHRFMVTGSNPTPMERMMYATLLSAMLSGKQVWATTGGCDGSFEKIVFVSLSS